ncbi:MAG: hypothetical protein WDN29_05845 [Methylovirgula sp.]
MKKLILASVLVVVACAPALADDTYSLVKDTVGNCSAAVTSRHYPGMTIVGDKTYSSIEDANKALDDVKGLRRSRSITSQRKERQRLYRR